MGSNIFQGEVGGGGGGKPIELVIFQGGGGRDLLPPIWKRT